MIPVMPTEEITGAMGERECATQVPRFAFKRSGTWTDLTDLGCFWFAWGQQLMAMPLHIAPHSESLGTCVSKTFRQREDQRRAGNKKPSVVPENLCETNRTVVKTPGTKLSQPRYTEILLVDVARFVEFLEFSSWLEAGKFSFLGFAVKI